MNVLAADTSSAIASVALRTDKSYEERLVSGCFSPSEDLLSGICADPFRGLGYASVRIRRNASVTRGRVQQPHAFAGNLSLLRD